MKYIPILMSLFFISCTTTLHKEGASQADYQSDYNDCNYQVTLQAGQVDNSLNTMIGQEFELAYRKKNLILSCMYNKGWSKK
jgi:hypothetical protein